MENVLHNHLEVNTFINHMFSLNIVVRVKFNFKIVCIVGV